MGDFFYVFKLKQKNQPSILFCFTWSSFRRLCQSLNLSLQVTNKIQNNISGMKTILQTKMGLFWSNLNFKAKLSIIEPFFYRAVQDFQALGFHSNDHFQYLLCCYCEKKNITEPKKSFSHLHNTIYLREQKNGFAYSVGSYDCWTWNQKRVSVVDWNPRASWAAMEMSCHFDNKMLTIKMTCGI